MVKLTSSDLSDIFFIVSKAIDQNPELASQGFSWDYETLKKSLELGHAVGLRDDNCLKAFILYRDLGGQLEIDLLCTHPDFARRGVMEALFKEFCKKNQAKDVWLEVHEKNLKALKFYKKMGFKQSGVRPKYYKDDHAAILMTFNQ